MSNPIVYRSEIIDVLKNTNAGSSGTSSTLAALNSQLVSLTARIAKLENSDTYEDEQTSNSFWYNDDIGICVASGATVLTSSVNAGGQIKLTTIDSAAHLPSQTTFVGAATAYQSSATSGGEPVDLALSFNGTDLMATAESYISASSSNSWYIRYSTMWMKKNFTGTSTATVSNLTFPGSSSSTDYATVITAGGMQFVFAYVKSFTRSTSSQDVVNAPSQSGWDFTNGSRGGSTSFFRNGNTVISVPMVRGNSAYYVTPSDPLTSGTTYSVYHYAVYASSTASDITLGVYTPKANCNATSSFAGYTSSAGASTWHFRNGKLNIISFYMNAQNYKQPGTWTPQTILMPTNLPDSACANFVPILTYYNNSLGRVPVDIANGRVTVALKPDLPTGATSTLYLYGPIIFLSESE